MTSSPELLFLALALLVLAVGLLIYYLNVVAGMRYEYAVRAASERMFKERKMLHLETGSRDGLRKASRSGGGRRLSPKFSVEHSVGRAQKET